MQKQSEKTNDQGKDREKENSYPLEPYKKDIKPTLKPNRKRIRQIPI